MIITTVAGNVGKDAEHKTTQSGAEFCRFSLAGESGYGENKQSIWFDVTSWGKGSASLAGMVLKGTKVTVSGELSTREHEGKTYLQIRADRVKLQGDRAQSGGPSGQPPAKRNDAPPFDDLGDDVPFMTCDPSREGRVG